MSLKRLVAASVAACLAFAAQAATVGQPAPDFTATDVHGKTVRLSDFRGKHVVLEWTNPGCPFVVKHYSTGNMQQLQAEKTAKGVVWLTINSTAKSHGDYLAPPALDAKMTGEWKGKPTHLLMDESGAIGKAYGAKTTPHMYIVNPQGVLVFAGGIDDKRSANPADVKTAKNWVRAALEESMAGKPISNPTPAPYGCSVKYG
ncbi:MAG: thioredoxin family protein [Casimicrobiaceae bacterium]|nr:thioredoxin family protein [Casimicrobiaceae bacterium]MCX8099454.1 thioredoxin family protein [Casimicrobiaceae bacterium]MDW8312230.1 thioredoxin family protein [Burkholderiales bacterium]